MPEVKEDIPTPVVTVFIEHELKDGKPKSKGGRPKGSKNKPKDSEMSEQAQEEIVRNLADEVQQFTEYVTGRIELIEQMSADLHSIDTHLAATNDLTNREIKEVHTEFTQLIDKRILDYNKNMFQTSRNEIIAVKQETTALLDQVNTRLTDVQNYVIGFLYKCQDQNQNLIDQIPVQKRTFDWKDAVIGVIAFLTIMGKVLELIG